MTFTPDRDPLDPMDGEVGRALIRIETSVEGLRTEIRERSHALKNELTLLIKPISTLEAQAANTDKQIVRIDGELKQVVKDQRVSDVRSAAISGGIAVLGYVAHLLWLK